MSRYIFQLELGEDSLGQERVSDHYRRWLDLGDITESFFLVGILPLIYTEVLSSVVVCKDHHAAHLIASTFNTCQSKYIIFPIESPSKEVLSSSAHYLYNLYMKNAKFHWSDNYVTLSSLGMDPNESVRNS